MSGYEHQYVNNDNVVNMSAERLVDALFKQLKQLFPAAVVTNLKTPEQEVAAKQQWIAAFAEGGIRTREQVSAGMRHARASESPFWPSPGQFIKWCKDSKMVLGVTIDDVMAEFHRYSKEKSLYPGGPERFPWRHPVMYWVVCDMLALGPVKALQLLQKRKSQLIDKATNPPMVAPTSLKNQRASLLPGDITYIDQITGQDGFRPAYLVNPSIVPYSSAFCIRDDGKLLVMTYLRDQQVFAWAPQSSTGKYESTCSISEGNEDAVYFVVNRTVNGQTVRYIERLSSRLFTSDEDAFFVDSGLSYDGRNTSDRTMTITGGSGEWDYRAEYTISISGGAYFTSSDVGAQLQFPYTGTDPDTGDEVSKELRCDIISVTSNTAVVVRANRNVPPSLRNVATTNWQMARRTFGGLSHLEGQTVNILSDANVEPQKVVSGGAVTLESPGAVVHIGLPITAEFETLDININGQETLLDKKQVIPSVTLVVNASRGIWATTPGGKWYEYPQREFEFYDDPVDDATGKVEVKLDSNWGKNGRVKIRQLDPLPLSVLAVIPRLTVGGF
ncbi:TPA: hypothetical protein JLG24_000396 [Escherichia coli]|nr:hypothetical protein [Escherichia coli]